MRMIETYYRILKHGPDGRLVKDTGLIPSHSYVIQLLEFYDALWRQADKDATDVDGAESVLVDADDIINTKLRASAGAGADTYGIVVGTNAGTTAEDNENYALDTKIVEGSGGGQLSYQSTGFVAPHEDAGNVDLHVSRAFQNESGGTISVKEIGIIIRNSTDAKYHLILRDVVAQEDVDDAETLTVIYTLRTTA